MEIGIISAQDASVFKPFLLPETVEAIAMGEPVPAFGLTEKKGKKTLATGALAGHTEEDLFRIDSLYVAPDYRRKGGASLLMNALFDLLSGVAVSGIEFSYTRTTPEQESLDPFLYGQGFSRKRVAGDGIYMTTMKETYDAPRLGRETFPKQVIRFAEADDYTLRRVSKDAQVAEAPLPAGGLFAETVDRDVSVLLREQEETAYLALEQLDDRALAITAAYHSGGSPMMFLTLLQAALMLCREKYAPENVLFIPVVSRASEGIVKKLLPSAKEVSRTWTAAVTGY